MSTPTSNDRANLSYTLRDAESTLRRCAAFAAAMNSNDSAYWGTLRADIAHSLGHVTAAQQSPGETRDFIEPTTARGAFEDLARELTEHDDARESHSGHFESDCSVCDALDVLRQALGISGRTPTTPAVGDSGMWEREYRSVSLGALRQRQRWVTAACGNASTA